MTNINPFDPPALIKTPPVSAPQTVRTARGTAPPPLPAGRPLRIPLFDDDEDDDRDVKPSN